MYSTYSKWIHVLIMLLALVSMGQFIFTSSLLFLISIILAKTAGYVSTIAGLIASLICLPTSFKIRSFYSDMRSHHYDMHSYYRYMLYISLTVQLVCALICSISLFGHKSSLKALTVGLVQYTTRPSDKKFVDIVQMLFQCCGIFTYQDWATKRWVNVQKQQIFCGGQYSRTPAKSVFSPTANCRLSQLSGVPYSCCKADHMSPCKNFDIKCSGEDTINKHGCLSKLCNFIISILFSELSLYLLTIFIIIILLKFQSLEINEMNSNPQKQEFKTIFTSRPKSKVPKIRPNGIEKEIKTEKLNSAEIHPSSQKHSKKRQSIPNKKSTLEATIYPTNSNTQLLQEPKSSLPAVKKNSLYDSMDHISLKETVKEPNLLKKESVSPLDTGKILSNDSLNTGKRLSDEYSPIDQTPWIPKLLRPKNSSNSVPPAVRLGTRYQAKSRAYPIKVEMLIPIDSSESFEASSESNEQNVQK